MGSNQDWDEMSEQKRVDSRFRGNGRMAKTAGAEFAALFVALLTSRQSTAYCLLPDGL